MKLIFTDSQDPILEYFVYVFDNYKKSQKRKKNKNKFLNKFLNSVLNYRSDELQISCIKRNKKTNMII